MKNLVIIILLFISTNCFTQDKYINGFIITLNGDTIYGLIDVDKPFNNNRICNFKKDLSSESSIMDQMTFLHIDTLTANILSPEIYTLIALQ
jgi:hypothetical protein